MNIDKLEIRIATFSDARIIFNLSNENIVRQNSINKDFISWENHIEWFQKKLRDDNYIIYVVFQEGTFVGQIKYEIKNDEALISISIGAAFRGKNVASKILEMSYNKLFQDYKNIKNIFAYIKPENIPSIKSFLKAGFKKADSDMLINQEQYYVFVKNNNDSL